MDTIKLNSDNWDLELDASGNMYAVDGNERLAQDVATACRVWRGEALADIEFGVPYRDIMGNRPALSLISAYLGETALTVTDVTEIEIDLQNADNERLMTGSILINGAINVNI